MVPTWVYVAGFLVTISGNLLTYLATRSNKSAINNASEANANAISDVHGLVNDQLDRQLRYSQQLTGALIDSGTPVPRQEQPHNTKEVKG